MAAGGECPALGSLWHRSRLGPAGLPSLSQPWLYLPSSPWCRLEPDLSHGGLEEEGEGGLCLQEQGGTCCTF